MLNTPVLFIVFNRPDTTAQVFEAIRQAKPKQLFVAADGPRPNKDGEKERCEIVRQIATKVDWDCELRTLFRSENRGCGRGPAEAITWFFENVEQGIILEDDCLPDQSFFWFCEELLNLYKENKSIMLISGLNLLNKAEIDFSYLFSFYAGIWGWATWRRVWEKYDYEMHSWQYPQNKTLVKKFFKNSSEYNYFQRVFDRTFEKKEISWWDYQFFYYRIITDGKGIIPKVNLISNIGFGVDATHTFDVNSFQSNLLRGSLEFPLKHPNEIQINYFFDKKINKLLWNGQTNYFYLSALKSKIKKTLKKYLLFKKNL